MVPVSIVVSLGDRNIMCGVIVIPIKGDPESHSCVSHDVHKIFVHVS